MQVKRAAERVKKGRNEEFNRKKYAEEIMEVLFIEHMRGVDIFQNFKQRDN